MIIKENITENIVRYYSDSGKYIRRIEDGTLFDERLDVPNGRWTYEEAELDLPTKDVEEQSASEENETNGTEEK